MSEHRKPETAPMAVEARNVPPRAKASNYPAVFAERVAKRVKRPLGDLFGLKNFGVNLTTLEPGGISALRHRHTRQDEFIYVLEGEPVLLTDEGALPLRPGMCAGFPAGGTAHQLINPTAKPVLYLEVGDRLPGDSATYPDDDIQAVAGPDGKWQFTHKDGTPY
jgi:uncharacterized cupin superfamily protein